MDCRVGAARGQQGYIKSLVRKYFLEAELKFEPLPPTLFITPPIHYPMYLLNLENFHVNLPYSILSNAQKEYGFLSVHQVYFETFI